MIYTGIQVLKYPTLKSKSDYSKLDKYYPGLGLTLVSSFYLIKMNFHSYEFEILIQRKKKNKQIQVFNRDKCSTPILAPESVSGTFVSQLEYFGEREIQQRYKETFFWIK